MIESWWRLIHQTTLVSNLWGIDEIANQHSRDTPVVANWLYPHYSLFQSLLTSFNITIELIFFILWFTNPFRDEIVVILISFSYDGVTFLFVGWPSLKKFWFTLPFSYQNLISMILTISYHGHMNNVDLSSMIIFVLFLLLDQLPL